MVAGAHAHAFYRDVAKHNDVWTIGLNGQPVMVDSAAGPVQPVWSTRGRVEKVIASVPGYKHCTVLGMPWDEFERLYLDHFERSGISLGLNWSGSNANGYEVPVRAVAASVAEARKADV
jgi:hypothetical protein